MGKHERRSTWYRMKRLRMSKQQRGDAAVNRTGRKSVEQSQFRRRGHANGRSSRARVEGKAKIATLDVLIGRRVGASRRPCAVCGGEGKRWSR